MQKNTRGRKVLLVLAAFLIFIFGSTSLSAQNSKDFAAERQRAIALVNAGNYTQAIPLLENLTAAKEADGQIFFGLGLAYWRIQEAKKDRAEWKAVRLKARRAG